jgi:acyl-CoA dehydrogenase
MEGYQLPEELRLLREQVRRVIQEDVIPAESRIDPDDSELLGEDYLRISQKVKAAGLWAPGVPKRYGGGGLDTFTLCVLLEEMVQHRMGLYHPGAGVFGRPVPHSIWAGSEEQIQQYAVPAIRNGNYCFFAITEPTGGSDPAGAIRTTAVRRGDRYVLNGTKVFISHANLAKWGVVYARTDAQAGRKGISAFIVETATPGFAARPLRTIRTSAPANEVTFTDCEIPAAQLIGVEGQGLDLAFGLLTANRFPYSAANIGIAAAAHKRAVEYANQRSTFGAYLADRQAIQWMLADSEMEIRGARWLIWEGAWKSDRGEDARVEASIAKVVSSEVLGRVIDRVVQIFGGYGVSKEFPFERWYREARVRRIGEGPSEVHRMVVARDLLRAGRAKRADLKRSTSAAD